MYFVGWLLILMKMVLGPRCTLSVSIFILALICVPFTFEILVYFVFLAVLKGYFLCCYSNSVVCCCFFVFFIKILFSAVMYLTLCFCFLQLPSKPEHHKNSVHHYIRKLQDLLLHCVRVYFTG